ncbi:MAG: FtsW/RodA/SpoVE family cell cycle protein [Clostridia bacterium]|nr:FtsW/RodA/SpoVE family cell cycle protein [Clostridia bacterium]
MPFFILVIALLTVGLIMMFSASFVSALYNTANHDSLYYIKRQLIFAVAGVAGMFLVSALDYKIIRKLTIPLFALTMVLLIVVRLLPPVDGVYRWINLGMFTIQPSEIAKFTIIAVLAHFIALHPDRMNKFKFILLLGSVIMIFVIMLMLEKHLSGTILIFAIGLCMLYAGGIWNKHKWAAPAIAFVGIAVLALLIFIIYRHPEINEHAFVRVKSWLDKDYDPLGARWQTNNSLYAIGSGGLLGSGLGQSMQKYLYVSEPQNDFIFAIVCEELGFIGAALILLTFCLLIGRGVMIAKSAKNTYASLLTMGIVFQVGIQVILNVAVVTDTIPNTGISLPFFSYGGTSLLMLLLEMGVVLSVSRTARLEKI